MENILNSCNGIQFNIFCKFQSGNANQLNRKNYLNN